MPRPQRTSRGSTQYNEAAAFQNIAALVDSESESAHSSDVDGDLRPAKRARSPESEHSDSASEFEPTGKAASPSSEDGDSGVEENESAAGREPTPESDDPYLAGNVNKVAKQRNFQAKVFTAAPAIRTQAARKAKAGERFAAVVKATPPANFVRLPAHQRSFGLSYTADFISLTNDCTHQIHSKPVAGPSTELVGCQRSSIPSDVQLLSLATAWSRLPFAPPWTMLQDVSYSKGKYTSPDRWGRELPTRAIKYRKLDKKSAEQYRPKQLYASRKLLINAPKLEKNLQVELLEPAATPEVIDVDMDEELVQDEGHLVMLVGPKDDQHKIALDIDHDTDKYHEIKPGYMGNAGGYVSSIDWCPQADLASPAQTEYLAVATLSTIHGQNKKRDAKEGLVQIWALDCTVPGIFARTVPVPVSDKSKGLWMALGICLNDAEPWKVRWCPRGGVRDDPKSTSVGLLAVSSTDGKIRCFQVPTISTSKVPVFVQLDPVSILELPDTRILCFDWRSSDSIVAGCENGHIAVFHLPNDANGLRPIALPTAYFPVHVAPLTGIAISAMPPIDVHGQFDLDQDSQLIASCSIDGTLRMTDLREPGLPAIRQTERCVQHDIAYQPALGGFLVMDQAHCVSLIQGRARSQKSTISVGIYSHSAPATVRFSAEIEKDLNLSQSLATSDHHPFAASASFDGTVMINNTQRRIHTRGHTICLQPHYSHIVFALDFNRTQGIYRMLDNFEPRLIALSNSRKTEVFPGAYLPEVATTAVRWSKNIRRGTVLATGCANGLFRIDVVGAGDSSDTPILSSVLLSALDKDIAEPKNEESDNDQS